MDDLTGGLNMTPKIVNVVFQCPLVVYEVAQGLLVVMINAAVLNMQKFQTIKGHFFAIGYFVILKNSATL